jgi:long-chain acyl-CoA synthetase
VELVGRIDQMLKVGGRKVHPEEVERVLGAHPSVAESAVVGMPDPRALLENVLWAFVVPRGPASAVSAAELLDHCRQHLEPYKLPAHVRFREALPKSPVGKVLKTTLTAEETGTTSPTRRTHPCSS